MASSDNLGQSDSAEDSNGSPAAVDMSYYPLIEFPRVSGAVEKIGKAELEQSAIVSQLEGGGTPASEVVLAGQAVGEDRLWTIDAQCRVGVFAPNLTTLKRAFRAVDDWLYYSISLPPHAVWLAGERGIHVIDAVSFAFIHTIQEAVEVSLCR